MRILFSITILCTSLIVNCQIQPGIFAGPIATTAHYTVNGVKQDNRIKFGFQAGALLKVPFEYRLSFSPAIKYNMRGYKVKLTTPSELPDYDATDNNTRFHTVEIAFLLQHDFNLKPGHAFFRIGPSLDFVLFGKETFNTNNGSVKRNMKFGFTEYGRYLAAAIIQLGFESKNGIFIYGHYNYGLTTMNNSDFGPNIGNRAFGISIGKFFKNNKIVLDTKNKE